MARSPVDIDSGSYKELVELVPPTPVTPVSYRTGLVAADVLAATGTVTCTLINSVGDLGASATVYIAVVAGNAYGRSAVKAGNTTVGTTHPNECAKAAFAAVAGATFYDIYCSTDASPKWVGRITETQRASGIIIDAVGSTAVGGAVDSVYIYAIGTGLVGATTAAVSTAYVIPAAVVDCTGYTYCDFLITCTRTGDAVAPALTVVPYLLNSRTSTYFPQAATTHTFGGTTAAYNAMKFTVSVTVRGCPSVGLLIQNIAGTGMSVDMDYVLS